MIECAAEFIQKLKGYFDSDSMSVELEDAYKSWLRKKNFSAVEFENLYDLITENFNKLPRVSYAAKIWNEQGLKINKRSYGFDILDEYKNRPWQSIIEEIIEIRNIQDTRELTTRETGILHEFEDLKTVEYLLRSIPSLIMPQTEKDTYMRKVKEDVVNRVPINIAAVRKSMSHRMREYEQKYSGEETENSQAQITRAVNDLFTVFDDNKKLFQEEPDRKMI